MCKTEHLENGFNRVQVEDWDYIRAAYRKKLNPEKIPRGLSEPMFCMSCMSVFPIKMFKIKGFNLDHERVWCPGNNCKKRLFGHVIPFEMAQNMIAADGMPIPEISEDIILKGDYLFTLI